MMQLLWFQKETNQKAQFKEIAATRDGTVEEWSILKKKDVEEKKNTLLKQWFLQNIISTLLFIFGVKLGGNSNEYITNRRVKGMEMNHGKRMKKRMAVRFKPPVDVNGSNGFQGFNDKKKKWTHFGKGIE